MKILRFVQKLKVWRLWLLSVILAILITEVVVSAMGLLLLGEITNDYLLTGLVASFLAASLVAALILYFVRELKRLSESLQRQVTLEVARSREKDHLLIQQSRLAAMGEMIGSIAHQWRQPLNALGLVLANIRDAYDHNQLNRDYLYQTVDNGRRLIREMSGTIDEFRNFHRSEEEQTAFPLRHGVESALAILQGELEHHGIEIRLRGGEGIIARGYPREYSRALLNLLTNAKDALLTTRPAAPRIDIELAAGEGEATVRIRDNGGGIPAEILPRIFDPYFTTRDKGAGVGLYLAKAFIETHMEGRIEVRNTEDGAEFLVACPLAPTP